ncbi:unnamed protein product, partial [Closterium sp. NIES-54]
PTISHRASLPIVAHPLFDTSLNCNQASHGVVPPRAVPPLAPAVAHLPRGRNSVARLRLPACARHSEERHDAARSASQWLGFHGCAARRH